MNNGFIVESSLGYFMAPLVNVLMGVAVFRERLRPMQWVAVAFARVPASRGLRLRMGRFRVSRWRWRQASAVMDWSRKVRRRRSLSLAVVDQGAR